MDETKIKEFIEGTIKNTFAQIELSAKLKELDELKQTNKDLMTKISSLEEAEIPAEKAEELTEVVEKAIGEKVDSVVGEALAEIIEKVEAIESSMTDRQRIKKALSNKAPFKPMSRPAKAFTEGAGCEVEKELDVISDKLKNAKDQKEVEEVKNLLQAFISSASKKIKLSENEEDTAELEAYRELGTIEEIEAAVEVLETYAEEIGTIPELEAEESAEEDMEFETLASRRRKALASRKEQALASKKRVVSRKVSKTSSRAKKIQELREKSLKLSNLKKQVKENMTETSSKKEVPGALCSNLFSRK